MRRTILMVVLAAGLCCCVGVTDVARPFEPTARWISDRTTEGDRLVFGVPQSDDVDLELICLPHSERVEVFAAAAPRRPTLMMTFASGTTASRHYMRRTDSDNGYGGFVSADDPALVAFAQTGEIATSAAGKRIRFPPAKAMAAAFLANCRAPN